MSSSSSGRSRPSRGAKTGSTKLLADPVAEKHKSNPELDWVDKIPECLVYHPTAEEFQDPLAYIGRISEEASRYGLCKIVSPLKASVPASYVLTKEQSGFEFQAYVQPLRIQQWTDKDQGKFLIQQNKDTFRSFQQKANREFAKRFPDQNPGSLHPSYLEREYWLTMARGVGEVEYGANVDGTAFSADPTDQLGQSNANLKNLPLLPLCPLRLLNYQIVGVSTPMLYIGMLFSTFAWHVEDHFLFSINYHHSGAPKIWYGVPGNEASKLDTVALHHVYTPHVLSPVGADGAAAKLAEKTTMFPPKLLLQNNVQVYKAVQMPGDFMVTFPRAYHAGFSLGFNVGEAVNFSVDSWFPFGATAGNEYANIRKLGNVPYEELLCKEAIVLSNSLNDDDQTESAAVKSSFVSHFESLANSLLKLNTMEARFSYSPKSEGTIPCELCKRDIYLTFRDCNRCHKATCLFHELESLDCLLYVSDSKDENKKSIETQVKEPQKCPGQVIVYLREDISDVINAHKKLGKRDISSIFEQVFDRIEKLKNLETVTSSDAFRPFPGDSKKPRTKRGLRKPEAQPKFG